MSISDNALDWLQRTGLERSVEPILYEFFEKDAANLAQLCVHGRGSS